jgi:hypothetical protein
MAMVWKLICTHNRMFEEKACKREYEDGSAQFSSGMKMKELANQEKRRHPTQHGKKINVHSKPTSF